MGVESIKTCKSLFFDLDGTLYPSTAEMNAWIQQTIYAVGAGLMEIGVEQFIKIYQVKLTQLKSNTETLIALGLPGKKIFENMWEQIPLEEFVQPDPELAILLNDLANKYRLGILSNGTSGAIKKKLGIMGLQEVNFELIYASYDHGVSKPDHEPFLQVCAMMSLKPEEIAYVGDRTEVDIKPARAVGMKTVMVWGQEPLADWSIPTIKSLSELLTN